MSVRVVAEDFVVETDGFLTRPLGYFFAQFALDARFLLAHRAIM
jgi:hypothetical protein